MWMMATLATVPAFAVPALMAGSGGTASRLVAVQLSSTLATLVLALMTFAFDQNAFIDLALGLALLALPASLLLALFLERWL